MKKALSVLTAMAVLLATTFASAIPQNLPHHNSADVDATVKEFIPWNAFHTVNDLSLANGTPSAVEVGTIGLGAIRMDAAGEDVEILKPLPDNVCVDCPIKISVLWSTTSTTTSQTATWKILYNAVSLGEALASPTTALNTAITADAADDTAYGLNETAQGVINASTLTRGDVLQILAELDAVSGLDPSTAPTYFHGIYFEYVRQQL